CASLDGFYWYFDVW
nr:immunoglobulin heavy chain junction region [Mus musculus]